MNSSEKSGSMIERVKELTGLGCGPWGVVIKEESVIPVGNFFCEALTCTCKAWVLPFQSESKSSLFLSGRNSATERARAFLPPCFLSFYLALLLCLFY